jgi:transcriptional regulator MraZ
VAKSGQIYTILAFQGWNSVLRGNATATIDEKGRLKIPANFRSFIDASWGSDFYVTSLSGESVLIYPLPVWQEIEERLAKLPSFDPTKKKFLDRTNYYGHLTSADKSGRVLIPTLLRESADMAGEVAVLGYLNHLDVWNHKRFVGRIKDHEFGEEDYGKLGI